MAVRKKSAPKLPSDLQQMLDAGFRLATIAKAYEERSKQQRAQIQDYLESTEEVEIEIGKGLAASGGKVLYQLRTNYKLNQEAMIGLLKEGYLTPETLVSLAFPNGTIRNASSLQTALGDRFDEVTSATETTFVQLRASSETKARIREEFAIDLADSDTEEEALAEELRDRVAEIEETQSPPEVKSLEEILALRAQGGKS